MAAQHRTLRFKSLKEAMAEAERLAASQTQTTGQFSLGQIHEHLARTLEVVLGERTMPPVSLPIRIMARLIRPVALRKSMTGFKLPAKAQHALWPDEEVTTEEGLKHLCEAYAKFKSADPLPKHVVFGSMTRQQHDMLQCRHFEGHLGFVHPA